MRKMRRMPRTSDDSVEEEVRSPPGAGGGDNAADAAAASRRRRAELLDRISTKVQALFWVVLAVVTATYADVLRAAIDPAKSVP